jgi:hypothetical protein
MNLIFHDLLRVLMEVYIDDVVVKYGLPMNPLKCAFGVTSGRFLGSIVHEHGIQIDPKEIESIGKIGEPVCKKDVQKLLGKINYLCRFIFNLARRVEFCYHWFGSNMSGSSIGGGGQNSEKLSRRSKNTSCLHPCCELQRPRTRSRCILLRKNGLLELFYYKKRMGRSFQSHTWVDIYMMMKHGMFSWKNFACLYTMLAPSLGITSFLGNA